MTMIDAWRTEVTSCGEEITEKLPSSCVLLSTGMEARTHSTKDFRKAGPNI